MEPNVLLEGISRGTAEVQRAECSFPTIDTQGNPVVLSGNDGPLTSCAVHFEQGRHTDHEYCGTITLPDGTVIVMTYASGVWSLPTLTKHKAAKLHHWTYLSVIKSLQATISEKNPYKALLDLAYNSEQLRESALPANIAAVKEIDERIMQLLHDRWGH
eukprot:1494447-Rhodomonas_salina.1